MTPPRPKKEYEEREADSTGTPLQRFERALKKVMQTPKERADVTKGTKSPRASA